MKNQAKIFKDLFLEFLSGKKQVKLRKNLNVEDFKFFYIGKYL
jgi:hypothetical protein